MKMTTTQAAQVLGICTRTLYRYESRGIVQPRRDFLGRRMFTERDLEKVRQHQGGGDAEE